MIRRGWTWLILGLTLAFFVLFFFGPLFQALKGGFLHGGKFTPEFFLEIFRNPIYREGVSNSFRLALATTLLVAALGLPMAFLAARCDFPAKRLLGGLVLVPMVLPPFVGAIGISQMLGRFGALNALLVQLGFLDWSRPVDWLGQGRFWAVAATQALHLYPIFYLNASAALANIDPAMEEAAENLGASGGRRFWRITLPLAAPGLFAGGSLVFIWAFTELGTPLMFDYTRVTAVQIYDGIKDIGDNPLPYALVTFMMITSILIYAAGKFLFGRQSAAMLGKSAGAAETRRLTGGPAWLASGLFLLVFLAAALPHLGVILTSFSRGWYQSALPSAWTLGHYREALGHALTLPSIKNSLYYATLALTLDMVLGVAIAYLVVRGNFRGRGLLDLLAMLPLAVPGIVLAFGYIAISQPGRLFAAFNPANNPTLLLIIAYAVRRLPYVVRSVTAGLQQTAEALEESAQNLGASTWHTLRRITLPLISANLIAGGLFAFSFAMLEVSDSLMLAQKQAFFPITKALYELFQILGTGRYVAAALGVWAMLFLTVTILAANSLLGRKLGALFRI